MFTNYFLKHFKQTNPLVNFLIMSSINKIIIYIFINNYYLR